MKATVAALFAASAFTCIASAEDKPIIAPPPSWVKPTSLPTSVDTDDQSPVRILLSDQQIQLERGKETVYSNIAVKIQTPQGLPLVAKGATLTRMLPAPLSTPTQDTSIRIDASAGISAPAPTTIETILRGDEAMATNAGLANLATAARDQALKAYWKNQYDFIEVKSSSASFDPKTGEQGLTMEGTAKLDWANGNYQTDGTNVGYRADFSRDPGMDKDAPFAVPYTAPPTGMLTQ